MKMTLPKEWYEEKLPSEESHEIGAGCLTVPFSDWALAALIDIQKVATKARSNHSVQGHQCALRAALDSICDRAASGLKAELEHRRNQNIQTHDAANP